MKKKKESKLNILLPIVSLVIVGIMFLSISAVRAEVSVMDRLLQIAGNVWGNRLPIPEAGEISFGAMPGSEIFTEFFTVNGITTWYKRHDGLKAASTTPCALQSPAATSTLQFASIQLDVSTTSISIIEIAKSVSTDNTATTTKIGSVTTLSASATNVSIVASTTPSGTNAFADGADAGKVGSLIFAPNEWLVFKMIPDDTDGDGTPGTVSPTGVCQAEFKELR